MSALTEETLDLDERLEVYVDTETYASTVVKIRAEHGETLKEIEIIGGEEKGQDTIVNGDLIEG